MKRRNFRRSNLFNRKSSSPRQSKRSQAQTLFEPLEPRILLSADLVYDATVAAELLLQLNADDPTMIQIVDAADQTVVAEQALSETESIIIHGSSEKDHLSINTSRPFEVSNGIHFVDTSDADGDTLQLFDDGSMEADDENLEATADEGTGTDEQSPAEQDPQATLDQTESSETDTGSGDEIATDPTQQDSEPLTSTTTEEASSFENEVVTRWVISGIDTGTIETFSNFVFSGIENLIGNLRADLFAFLEDGATSGIIDGGLGAENSLDYSARTSDIVVDLELGEASDTDGIFNIQNVLGGSGNDLLIGDANNNILIGGAGDDSIMGGAGDDTLEGGVGSDILDGGVGDDSLMGDAGDDTLLYSEGSDTYDGGAGTDTLKGGSSSTSWEVVGSDSGTINGQQFFSIENLFGGTGTDQVSFAADSSLTGTVDGGAGDNTVDYSTYNEAVAVNLTTGQATATGGVSNIQNATGGMGDDVLIGDTLFNQLLGGGGDDTLTGKGGGDDVRGGDGIDRVIEEIDDDVTLTDFTLTSALLGTEILLDIEEVSLVGGDSGSIFDLSAYSGSATVTAGGGNDIVIAGAGAAVIDGGEGLDELHGQDQENIWRILGIDAGEVGEYTFESIENLVGGAMADSFLLGAGALIGGFIDGRSGRDSLNYLLYSAGVVVDMGSGTATGVVGGIFDIEDVLGSAANDTLLGALAANYLDAGEGVDTLDFSSVIADLNITVHADSSISATDGVDTVQNIRGIENIVGGSGTNTYVFENGAALAGDITGSGPSILDYSAYTSEVNVDLAAGSATGTSGVVNVTNVIGGSGNDMLYGPSADSTWNVTGENSGEVGGVTFSGIGNLTGAADNEDTFVFTPGGSISGVTEGGAGGFDVTNIDGGSYDTVVFDYTGNTSGLITLDGNIITYGGMEPIGDSSTAATKIFNFSDFEVPPGPPAEPDDWTTANTVVVSDYTTSGWSQLDPNVGETVRFKNPTGDLILNAGTGDDTIVLHSLDTGFDITIDGGADNDTYSFNNSGGSLGNVEIVDGSGNDTLDFTNFSDTFTTFSDVDATSPDLSLTLPSGDLENLAMGADAHIELSTQAITAFLEGLENLTLWAEKFAEYGDFATGLPGIAGNVDVTVENAIDVAGSIDQLRIKILNYLEGITSPITTDDLFDALVDVAETGIQKVDRAIVGDLEPDFSGIVGTPTFDFEITLKYLDSATNNLVTKTQSLIVDYAGTLPGLITKIREAITSSDWEGQLTALENEGRVAIKSTVSGFQELKVKALNTVAEDVLGFSTDFKSVLAGKLEQLGNLDIDVVSEVMSFDFVGNYPQLKFDFNYEADRTNSFQIDLGESAADIGIQFDTDLSAKLAVDSTLVADFNLYLGLDSTPEFSIDINSLEADLIVNGAVNAGLMVGFIEANAAGTVNLLGDIDVVFGTGTGITSSNLSTFSIDSLNPGITASSHFILDLDISITPSLNGYADPGTLPHINVTIGDIFGSGIDRDDITVTFTDFAELVNFDNINPSAIAGLLVQLAGWLDGLSGNRLDDIDIPFTSLTVEDILDFESMFSDKLLFDDGDSSIFAKKKIVNDLNSALLAAGVGDRLRVEGDGAKLKLVATDPDVTSVALSDFSGSGWLGFAGTDTFSGGELIASSNAFLPITGLETPGDDVFKISINGEDAVTVTVSEDSLLDNLAVGYNIPKLLNFDNTPTFDSAQEFATQLMAVLGAPGALAYNATEKDLTFTLDLTASNKVTLFNESVPLNFNLDLSPIVDLSTDATINLSADGSLFMTIGIDLDATGTSLVGSTALSSLNGGSGVDIKTNASYLTEADVAETSWRLSEDASFTLDVGGSIYNITIPKASTFDYESIADLVAGVNAELTGEGAGVTASSDYDADTNKHTIVLSAGQAFSLTASPSDTAVRELGFGAAQSSNPSNEIEAQSDLRTTYGRFGTDISFTVDLVGLPGGSTTTHVITLTGVDSDGSIGIDSSTNSTVIDVVSDINKALREKIYISDQHLQVLDEDGKIDKDNSMLWAEFVGNRILITAGDTITSFTIDASDTGGTINDAVDMLGFTGGVRMSDYDDLVINTHNGTVHTVSIGDGTSKAETVADVIARINTQTLGQVTASLNDDNSGFKLVDTTGGGTTFIAFPTNGSKAAYQLGIAGVEGLEDINNDSVVDAEDGYGIIEGAQIAGVTFADRFFVEGAMVSGDVAISAANATASAIFGDFVGITLTANGLINGHVDAGLKNPDTGIVGDRVSLAQLVRGVSDIDSIVQTPSFTGGGSLTVDVALEPDISSLIDLGPTPQFEITVDNPFSPSMVTETLSSFDIGATSFDLVLDVPGYSPHIIPVILSSAATAGVSSAAALATAMTTAIQSGFVSVLGAGVTAADYIIVEAVEAGGIAFRIVAGERIDDFNLENLTGGAEDLFGSLSDVASDFIPDIDFDFDQLGELLKFEIPAFNFDSIMAALIQLTEFIGSLENFDFLNENLPLIDMSINDVLDYHDRLQVAINEALANPAGTIQFLEAKLEEALGLGDTIALTLASFGGADLLKLEIDLATGFSEFANLSIPEINIPVLGEVFDLGGAANLNVSGNIALDLDFGIDLNDPLNGIYVYNTTGLTGNLGASATGIEFRAALGPMGLWIKEGRADISGSIFAGFASGSDPIISFTDFDTLVSALTVDVNGDIDINLPTYFPTEFNSISAFDFDVDALDWDALTPAALLSQLDLPDFSSIDLSSIGLFDVVILAVDGIDQLLAGLQDVLDGEVFGIDIPFIGNKLSAGSGYIQDFRVNFISDFRELLIEAADVSRNFTDPDENVVSKLLFTLLGDPLYTGEFFSLNLLKPLTSPTGTASDPGYYIDLNFDDPDDPTWIEWDFSLGDVYGEGTEVDFDFGIPGLGIEAEGDIGIEFQWDLDLGFGLSTDDGFYFDIADPNELFTNVGITLPSTIIGKLGFLQLRAEDQDVYEGHDGATNLDLAFVVDIGEEGTSDGKLTLSEFGQITLDAGIAAEAVAELMLYLEVNKNDLGLDPSIAAGIPKLQAGFILDWEIGDYNVGDPESSTFIDVSDIGNSIKDGLNLVEFRDVSLDVGSFLSDVLGPIVSEVKSITEPLQPIIDIITFPIPVLSDLGPPVTLLDIAAAFGDVDPGMIYSIADIISLVNRIPDPDSIGALVIPFGSFTVFDNRGTEGLGGLTRNGTPGPDGIILSELWNPGLQTSGENGLFNDLVGNIGDLDFDQLLEDFGDAGAEKSAMQDLRSGDAGSGFAFPIFEDPAQVFGLLMGEPAVLITYDMEPLFFEFEWSQFFSIWGPLGVSVNLEFGLNIDFAFGYDTLGIQRFIEGDFSNPATLLDGFYISDTDLPTGEFGTDVPELVFTGGLWAAAELNLGIARGGVGGGIFAEINFDLFDPNRDGRIRISELVMNFENQLKAPDEADRVLAPLAIFDVYGEITAELFAFIKIDVVFWEVDLKFPITPPITLVEFDIDFYRPPVLATELDNGDLMLNMGRFAKDRLLGDITDGNEWFEVRDAGPGYVEVQSQWLADAEWQKYEIGSGGKIIAYGDAGDDKIEVIDQVSASGFLFEGGIGGDIIDIEFSNQGDAWIDGGDGVDYLYGGEGDDTIIGGRGEDTIEGRGGSDIIFGDAGEIVGNNAAAVLKFDDADDNIQGGAGIDYIFGGGGDDTIDGGAGNDVILGDNGRINLLTVEVAPPPPPAAQPPPSIIDTNRGITFGNDILSGGADDDRIYGGRGVDTISGDAGLDEIHGEDGDDIISGGADNDTIYGNKGADVIDGDGGDDDIFGNEDNDTIHGNDGIDTIYGNSGADTIYGDAGGDFIYGGTEPDLIFGGTGGDEIEGGAGTDIVYGDLGPSDLVSTASKTWNENVYGPNTPDGYDFGTTYSVEPLSFPEEMGDFIIIDDGSDFADGQQGSDVYKVNLQGADTYNFINVYDSGKNPNDSDYMKVKGTVYDDTFLLRKSSSLSGLSFVALLNEAPNVERINYWSVEGGIGLERMLVSGLLGDDHFAVDDVGTDTTLEGNEGEDSFQVGQLYHSPRDFCAFDYNNIEPEDVFATIETTVGWLSDGINRPMTIFGGVGNDYFTVFHNKAVLSLYGEDGDDTFLIKAFAMAGSSEPFRDRTDVSGGAGVDLIQYAMNAPVNIDGGDGFDRVIIIGTEFGDDFVVTKDGVYGAGLNVNFVNIESLAVDGAEGDDRFYVMSTGEDFITELFGGLGSDTFNMSGDTPPIISNDLRGHSGVITHEIENTGTNYDKTIIEGVSANVYDNNPHDPVVIITEPDGKTEITEGGSLFEDYYDIVLSKAPDADVTVQVNAPVQTVDQFERKAKMFRLFSPTAASYALDYTTMSLVFTPAAGSNPWYTPQRVYVSAPDDSNPADDETIVMDIRDKGDYDDNAIEGDQTGFINHVVNTPIGIKGSPSAPPGDESVEVVPDVNDSTKFTTLITDIYNNFIDTLAGYIFQITDGPGAGQSLRILGVEEGSGGHTLILDGKFRECEGSVIGPDSIYSISRDIEANRAVTVLVHDNDLADVVVQESGVSTDIFEDGATDTIQVVLTRQPEDSNVTVTLASNDNQLEFSDSTLTFSKNELDLNAWDNPQTVTVSAFNDTFREGFHHGLITFSSAGGDSDGLESVTLESITLTDDQAYVGLVNRPALDPGDLSGETYLVSEVWVDGKERAANLYEVISNKIIFLTKSGDYEELKDGATVEVSYKYATVGYDGLHVKPLLTDIADDEVAQVKITQSGGFTDVVEVTSTDRSSYSLNSVPWDDSYSVVLTAAPVGGNVQILVDPQQTKTSSGVVINWGEQVEASSSAPGAVDNGDGSVTLTFTDANWETPQTVYVTAIDDDKNDGDDTQVFAPELHTVTDIQGPLYLYGEGGNGSIIDFEPTMLHYELNYMIETDAVESVAPNGTAITVPKQTLLDGAQRINDTINDLIEDSASIGDILDAFVSEMMTVTLADGTYLDEASGNPEFLEEIGQFRLIVDAVFNENGPDASDDTVTLTLNEAWDLSKSWTLSDPDTYDQITEYRITRMSPNFFADETEKIDYLFVHNEDSQADNDIASREGWLKDSTTMGYGGNTIVEDFATEQDGKWLYGFGMASQDLFLGGVLHPRGITYGDMEVVEINLGDGIDHFTVEDTHVRSDGYQTWTIINTGDEVVENAGDLVTVKLDSDLSSLHSGVATAWSDYSLTESGALFPLTVNGNGQLVGYLVEITGGTGLGQQRIIESHTDDTLTFEAPWDISPDVTSAYRILGAESHVGTISEANVSSMAALVAANPAISEIKELDVLIGDFSSFYSNELQGSVLEIIDGSGIGIKREIIAQNATQLTMSSSWNSNLDDTTVYRIYGDQDGPVAINAQGGDDTVDASASTIPVVIFGGDGEDTLTGGSADDIIFGDRGRVEYVNEEGKIVTLLGLARKKLDPQYIDAFTANTLTDLDGSFPVQTIDMQGLEGYMLSTPDGRGFGQRVQIIGNTPDTLTVTPEWELDEAGVAINLLAVWPGYNPATDFDSINPQNNPTKYRISLVPEDQTDGIKRDPSLIIAVDPGVGENDTIVGNGGDDQIFGGAADDTIHGNSGEDTIFGDHGRLDYTPASVGGSEGPSLGDFVPATLNRIRSTFDDQGGADTVYGDEDNDIIIGGFNTGKGLATLTEDRLFGGSEDDIILGDNAELLFSPNLDTAGDPRDVYLDTVRSIEVANGGSDIVHGNTGNDLILGQTGRDILSGDENDDLILGDFAEVNFIENVARLVETTHYSDGDMDVIYGNSGEDVLVGGDAGDDIDGGTEDDLIFGDQIRLDRWSVESYVDFTNPRYRTLTGSTIYDETPGGDDGESLQDSTHRLIPDLTGTPVWANWDIFMDDTAGWDQYGDDYIAGGGHDDTIFAQLGDDVVQGDGAIDSKIANPDDAVYAYRMSDGTLSVIASFEDESDGDDYIEGNGGMDVIFGNLGQDDILGGSSALFSLAVPTLRPDDSDLIFGGAGTDIARNNLGDASHNSAGKAIETYPTGHARDADMILGDNGNIFRLVSVGMGDATEYREFSYDQTSTYEDRGDLRIIPRAADLLDYTPGGMDYVPTSAQYSLDIGAADEIHGESGDDFIYGMRGADFLFGDGQDDDLIGGYGNDWISGGTGQDGVLGDDGRIYTSRNDGNTEVLYGIDAVTDPDLYISTPGKIQQSIINVTGALKKTVNLTPFSLGDPNTWEPLFDPSDADDIIYGGWGADFLHGGAGDDAISGAEALADFYNVPVNPGNVLDFEGVKAGEFADYDEYDPLLKIAGFLLNFDASETGQPIDDRYETLGTPTDGDDIIFGDLGNDWLVGGTGKDHMYGGYGNDLLNADDDHSTNGDANDMPDTDGTYEDIAYGGAGRDVLIANTGGDRLIDWVGEYNSYLVPFAPFGMGTVSRTNQPQLKYYLYDLSESDGADPTRAADTGGDPLRNGEPDGELGVVIQKDFDWHDQTGAPDDPQAGNIPGGKRDVLRSATFNNGNKDAFFADSGIWEAEAGRLQVSAIDTNGDAVSVFNVNKYLPSYYEVQATVNAIKPTGGYKANAYIIFDYIGPDDFKFAGINVSTDKIEMGHKTTNGWIVDVQSKSKTKPGTDYNLLLAVNGTTATLVVDGRDVFSHAFDPRIDADGWVYGLNDGYVGLGSNQARGSFDNVAVKKLMEYTLETTEDFDDPVPGGIFSDAPVSGNWQVDGGRYIADADSMSLVNLGHPISANAVLQVETVFNADQQGGVVFDYYDPQNFKFVALDYQTKQLIIGHRTGSDGWTYDSILSDVMIKDGTDYTMTTTYNGSVVGVALMNGDKAVATSGHVYNAVTVDGATGIFTIGGSGSFDSVTVRSDDPAFKVEEPAELNAAAPTQAIGEVATVSAGDLDPIVAEAIDRWETFLALDDGALDGMLDDVAFKVTDLGGTVLAETDGNTVWIDDDAAGYGWFIDPTPSDDSEFVSGSADGDYLAAPGSVADDKMDLLSTVMHELGHLLGFDHSSDGLMDDTLDEGARAVLENKEATENYLTFNDDTGRFEQLGRYNRALKSTPGNDDKGDDDWLIII